MTGWLEDLAAYVVESGGELWRIVPTVWPEVELFAQDGESIGTFPSSEEARAAMRPDLLA